MISELISTTFHPSHNTIPEIADVCHSYQVPITARDSRVKGRPWTNYSWYHKHFRFKTWYSQAVCVWGRAVRLGPICTERLTYLPKVGMLYVVATSMGSPHHLLCDLHFLGPTCQHAAQKRL